MPLLHHQIPNFRGSLQPTLLEKMQSQGQAKMLRLCFSMILRLLLVLEMALFLFLHVEVEVAIKECGCAGTQREDTERVPATFLKSIPASPERALHRLLGFRVLGCFWKVLD